VSSQLTGGARATTVSRVSVARLLAAVAAVAFVAGLAVTFGITYRNESHAVAQLKRERTALRAQNRRLSASLAAAQTALTSLGTALASTHAEVATARRAAGQRFLDGYAAGSLWAAGADPYGSAEPFGPRPIGPPRALTPTFGQ